MRGNISTLYMALLFGALIVVGLSAVQADIYAKYGQTGTDLSYINATNEVINQTGNIKDSIENTVITGIQPLDQFIASTYGTVKLLFGVINIYDSFVSDVAGILGIPSFLSATLIMIIMAMITLTVVFAIIRVVTHEQV